VIFGGEFQFPEIRKTSIIAGHRTTKEGEFMRYLEKFNRNLVR
jgi:hypothetical protein